MGWIYPILLWLLLPAGAVTTGRAGGTLWAAWLGRFFSLGRRRVPDWWLTKDGDVTCLALYEKHYSSRQYADGRKRRLFAGPGEKVVLRTSPGDAFFIWRKFRDACIDERTGEHQAGINCAAFRNEGTYCSSELIRQADRIADVLWPDCRHYTYVSEKDIRSGLPGACFLFAGWRYVRMQKRRARTKSGLLILERAPSP